MPMEDSTKKINREENNPIDTNVVDNASREIRKKMKKAVAVGVATVAFSGTGEIGIKDALADTLGKNKKDIVSVESSQQKKEKEKVLEKYHEIMDTSLNQPQADHQPVRTGTKYSTGTEVGVGTPISVGSGYSGYRDPLGQYHDITGRIYFPELSPNENIILQNHPEFSYNPFGLSAKKLIQTYEARNEDIEYVFRGIQSTWTWDKLGDLKANKILEYSDGANSDPAITKLSRYLNLLKNFTKLEPKKGFLGIGAESSEYYIARALQKLTADGKLEIFQASLRK